MSSRLIEKLWQTKKFLPNNEQKKAILFGEWAGFLLSQE
jgi:hypothetical protein